jgi:uncharacterized protein
MEAATLIRHARAAAGLTQSELARRAGVKQPEIARLESNGANPRLATLSKVVAATGHSLTLGFDRGAGIDETMIASNLRLSPEQRLAHFAQAYRSIAGLVSATRKHRGP